MTDPNPTPTSADVIEGMREALALARKALKPFADIALARDNDKNSPDHIDAVDLAITPKDVRVARKALAALALPDSRPDKGSA